MKYLTFILISFCLIGCNDDDESSEKFIIEGTELFFSEEMDLLPKQYFDGSSVIFKNEGGLERVFNIDVQKDLTTSQIENQSYTAENVSLILQAANIPNFSIRIDGRISYKNSQGDVKENISIRLIDENTTPLVDIISIGGICFLNKERQASFISFFESLTFLNKTFLNVFQSIDSGFVYSEWNMNTTEGVVAFKDVNNEYWVFDRFE